ncbi:MAG TPA: hypothetical protein VL401_03250 [Alphaproteobacteria bacterium]|jgi:hypothetical protein|nr:hypothetical protein [Alphaproteobacteria bacterium]
MDRFEIRDGKISLRFEIDEAMKDARLGAFEAFKNAAHNSPEVFEPILNGYGGSQWLRENLANLTYEDVEKRAKANTENSSYSEKEKTDICAELKRCVDGVIAPIIFIEKQENVLNDDNLDAINDQFYGLLDGISQNEVSDMIPFAKYYCPEREIKAERQYWATEDQPESLHRTEQGNGPLLAAKLILKVGKNYQAIISDDENNPGGLGDSYKASIEKPHSNPLKYSLN